MSILATAATSSVERVAPAAPPTKPRILVATDGTTQSDGAVAIAMDVARVLDARVEVLSVHRPVVLISPESALVVSPDIEQGRRADLLRSVNSQLERVVGDDACCDAVQIRDGDPPREIAEAAAERRIQLVITGLGRHEVIDRLFGDETALKLVRFCGVPVLAVPSLAPTALNRVVVATDFSEPSTRAAQAALRLVTPGASVQLVHVIPPERAMLEPLVTSPEYHRSLRGNFSRLQSRLDVPDGVEVQDVILRGNTAAEVLAFADRIGAQLIAVGSHGHGFIARLVVGSVTTKLLRGAKCALLVAPPNHAASALGTGAEPSLTQRIRRTQWSEALDGFTRRNVGRRTRLEVDDLAVGAQTQEQNYPLLGVSYDPHDDRIDLMLGDLGALNGHLTRSIGGIDAVDVLMDSSGSDVALRLAHGAGQTLLTFTD